MTLHLINYGEKPVKKVIPIPDISLIAIIITMIGFTSSPMLYMAAHFVTYFVERDIQKERDSGSLHCLH